MSLALEQIKFCAEECAKQQSGEISVFNMCEAFSFALERSKDVAVPMATSFLMVRLAQLIEPELNANGYRQCDVSIRNGLRQPPKAELVSRLMQNLIQGQDLLTPEEFYQEFQAVHAFKDGNGRTGAVLYLYLTSKLDNPIAPPKFQSPADSRGLEE